MRTNLYYTNLAVVNTTALVVSTGATLYLPDSVYVCNVGITSSGTIVGAANGITWCPAVTPKFVQGSGAIGGCMDPMAINFAPNATKPLNATCNSVPDTLG